MESKQKSKLKPIILQSGGEETSLLYLRENISKVNNHIAEFEENRNVKFTDEEVKNLLEQSLNIHSFIQKQNFKLLPPELREVAIKGMNNALEALKRSFGILASEIKGARKYRELTEVKNGRLFESQTAEAELRELFILRIDEEEKLALFHEAEHIGKRIVEIAKTMNTPIDNIFKFNFWTDQVFIESEEFANYTNYNNQSK